MRSSRKASNSRMKAFLKNTFNKDISAPATTLHKYPWSSGVFLVLESGQCWGALWVGVGLLLSVINELNYDPVAETSMPSLQ